MVLKPPPIPLNDPRAPIWIAANRAGQIAPDQWARLAWFHSQQDTRPATLRAVIALVAGALWLAWCVFMWDPFTSAPNAGRILIAWLGLTLPGLGLLSAGLFFAKQAVTDRRQQAALEADLAEHTIVHEQGYLKHEAGLRGPTITVHVPGLRLVALESALSEVPAQGYRIYYLERSRWMLSLEQTLPARYLELNAPPTPLTLGPYFPPVSQAEFLVAQTQHCADWSHTLIRNQGLTTATHHANLSGHASQRQRLIELAHILRVCARDALILFVLTVTCLLIARANFPAWSEWLVVLLALAGLLYRLAGYGRHAYDALTGPLASVSGPLDAATQRYIACRPPVTLAPLYHPRYDFYSDPAYPPPLTINTVTLHGLTPSVCAILKHLTDGSLGYTACYWPHSRRIAALYAA